MVISKSKDQTHVSLTVTCVLVRPICVLTCQIGDDHDAKLDLSSFQLCIIFHYSHSVYCLCFYIFILVSFILVSLGPLAATVTQ